MSLKEFDAKQFLLEKGERVGLGVALTLMVLMLIFSLFMPSKGFFSGSPAAKAEVLDKGAKELETALRTREPQPSDKPEDTAGRLIGLDKTFLQPDHFAVLGMFEPAIQESPARRPPKIYNLDESVVAVAHVLIDTYLFDRNFEHVYVLRDPDRKSAAAAGGGTNPFLKAYGKGGRNMPTPGAPANEGPNPLMQRNMQRLGGVPGSMNALQGPGSGDIEYELQTIPIDKWNSQELTARQPRPLRVAVIGGSFPYRRQLEEFKRQLRLPDLTSVLYETLADKESPGPAFNFVGVEVQRMEVDAAGNKLGEWSDLPLAETYQLWLKHTFWPFQPEDPKYNLVKFDGLVLPLLREFHADKKVDPTMMTPGMMMQPGLSPSSTPPGADAESADVTKSAYPDVVAQLKKVQETLDKLSGVQAAKIAAPKAKAEAAPFDPFRPYAVPPADETGRKTKGANDPNAAQDLTIPDHALVRLVDVNLEPGKNYKYRVRIRMNNPNYKRQDVASPEYKKDKYLTSKEWYEIPQVARVPTELKYYVVDERKEASQQEQREVIKKGMTAQSRLWAASKPVGTDPIVLQFQRWVEMTPVSKDLVPVGQWAIADRVFVSRGEYVGRKVRVDLPIWKVSKNAYVLPADPQKGVPLRKQTTGIDVDFGFDGSPKDETILVDFEGGRVISPTSKEGDVCRTEVLMLSPDGKLLARNSAKDVEDSERKDIREKTLKRIEDIREGKAVE